MSVPVSQAYPELMHYTDFAGLRGIVASGCLWATDAAFLNDASEIAHFFDVRLKGVIAATVRKRGAKLAQSIEVLTNMTKMGGFDKVVEAETVALVKSLREATLTINRPFILSLCGAMSDGVRRSGLLSQWRAYGSDGGYAVVFNTRALEDALRAEGGKYHNMHVQMGDVYYEGIDPKVQPATPDFEQLEETVRNGVARILQGGTADETSGFYDAVTSLSCLCKHWGFWEEREVRIVVVPTSTEVLQPAPEADCPTKTIRYFSRGSVKVPYLELLGTAGSISTIERLPINRVIVGPRRNSKECVAKAQNLLQQYGYDCMVHESEIPYIGR